MLNVDWNPYLQMAHLDRQGKKFLISFQIGDNIYRRCEVINHKGDWLLLTGAEDGTYIYVQKACIRAIWVKEVE